MASDANIRKWLMERGYDVGTMLTVADRDLYLAGVSELTPPGMHVASFAADARRWVIDNLWEDDTPEHPLNLSEFQLYASHVRNGFDSAITAEHDDYETADVEPRASGIERVTNVMNSSMTTIVTTALLEATSLMTEAFRLDGGITEDTWEQLQEADACLKAAQKTLTELVDTFRPEQDVKPAETPYSAFNSETFRFTVPLSSIAYHEGIAISFNHPDVGRTVRRPSSTEVGIIEGFGFDKAGDQVGLIHWQNTHKHEWCLREEIEYE